MLKNPLWAVGQNVDTPRTELRLFNYAPPEGGLPLPAAGGDGSASNCVPNSTVVYCGCSELPTVVCLLKRTLQVSQVVSNARE